MSERLDAIEQRAVDAEAARMALGGDPDNGRATFSTRDVLALVEIARAAQKMRTREGPQGDVLVDCDDWDALRAALARLDSPANEEQG